MCHIFFELERTLLHGAFCALLSFAVHVCLHTMGNKLENPTLPLPIARPLPKACPPFGQ